jgi:large subunit ribosomal protein L18
MAVSVSNRGICVQFIDDDRQATVAAAALRGKKNVEGARQLGREAAAAAIASGVGIVVVDRGGHKYHGRVQAVVEAAVEGGLRVSEKPAEGAASAGGPPPEEAGKSAARSKEAK